MKNDGHSIVTALRDHGIDVSACLATWGEALDLLAAVEALARAGGASVVVKVDGGRPGGSLYTLVISGGCFGESFFRKDAEDLMSLLGEGLRFYLDGRDE